MDSARWERVQALFHEAVALPARRTPRLRLGRRRRRSRSGRRSPGRLLDADERSSCHCSTAASPGPPDRSSEASAPRSRRSGRIASSEFSAKGAWARSSSPNASIWARQAAIKILRDAWLSPSRRRRFATEQRTLASLNHPVIARLFDAGVLEDGTPWIVMEYVDGRPITDYCRTPRDPAAGARCASFATVCDAVQYAHRHLVDPSRPEAVEHPGHGGGHREAA